MKNIYSPQKEIYIRRDKINKEGNKFQNSPFFSKDPNWKLWAVFAVFAIAIIWFVWFVAGGNKGRQGELIDVENNGNSSIREVMNEGEVSPITGLACENWNRRPIAVMQASDPDARPLAGISEADMVIEMPVITALTTRLMAVYICNDPEEVSSLRSSRHDFIHLAKGLDAVYVHHGNSSYAKEKLNEEVIDNVNCNNDGGQSAGECCFRKDGMVRGVDSVFAKFDRLLQCSEEFGYRMKGQFGGYPHQEDALVGERPDGGNLRVGFAGVFGVNYEYDKKTNSYLRIWGGDEDEDRNNDKRIAPKNVVVLLAVSEQIEEGQQYNDVKIGDPWYDTVDSGEAYYYMNGQEIKGTWRKNKSRIDSKLMFLDENGNDIEFVPGQIWVEVLEPGQGLKWRIDEEEEEKKDDEKDDSEEEEEE